MHGLATSSPSSSTTSGAAQNINSQHQLLLTNQYLTPNASNNQSNATVTATKTATSTVYKSINNTAVNNTSMLHQDAQPSGSAAAVTGGGGGAFRPAAAGNANVDSSTLNFAVKLKDNSSMMFSEQQQRKLEMLESRFVPLNPQKVRL